MPMVRQRLCINTLRPRQNGRHFADDMFKCIFLNENVWIPIEMSLTFVPKGPINNIPALVQIMAWRRPGDKPLSEAIYRRIYASVGLNQLNWPWRHIRLRATMLISYLHVYRTILIRFVFRDIPTNREKKGYMFCEIVNQRHLIDCWSVCLISFSDSTHTLLILRNGFYRKPMNCQIR